MFLYLSPSNLLHTSDLQCLSPAGEYNLRLGIIKELHPDMVATYSGRLWLLWQNFLILSVETNALYENVEDAD